MTFKRVEYVLESDAPYDGPIEECDEPRMQRVIDKIAPELNRSWEAGRVELEVQIAAARLALYTDNEIGDDRRI